MKATPLKRLGNKLWGEDSKHEIPNREIGRFTMGAFGQNVGISMMTFLLFYCVNVLYINPLLVGGALFAIRIWDAFTDIPGGILMDRKVFAGLFKSEEKFRPMLKQVALPMGVLIAFMFSVGLVGHKGVGEPNMLAFVLLMIAFFFYSILYTFQDIAQWGICSLAGTTSEERGRISQWGRTGAMVGGLPKEIIPLIIGAVAVGQRRWVFAVAGLILGLGGMLLSRFNYAVSERAHAPKLEENVLEPLKLLLKNKVVLLAMLSSILGGVTLTIGYIHFFEYLVSFNIFGKQLDGITSGFIFGLITGIPSMLGIFGTTKLAKKLGGMRNVLIFVPLVQLVCRVLAFAFVSSLASFNTVWGVLIAGFFLFIASTPNNMRGVAQTALFSDSLDKIELETGKRNEASVFAMINLIAKAGGALNVLFAGITLTLLRYDAGAIDEIRAELIKAGMSSAEALAVARESLSPVFVRWAWPVFMLAPAFGAILTIIPLLFIKHNKKEQERIESALKELRERNLKSEELPCEETATDSPLEEEPQNNE
ncbi:MAG: MFS transporter [Firmicutes bacterium]|nr:MFS transporter [Bacillota bacterium]